MHHELKQEAIRLRKEEELSYHAIRQKLGVSKSTLHEWLKHFPLTRERVLELRRINWKNNEAKIELTRIAKAEKKALKKQVVYEKYLSDLKDLSEDAFFVAGLMLYLAEGKKTDDYNLCLANTNVQVITFFIAWLNRYFNISKDLLRASLHLYPTMDIPKEYLFWKNELGFEDYQFYKTQIRKLKASSFSYPEPFRHGTCSLNFCSVEKKTEIMMAIRAFLDLHMPASKARVA